MTFFFFVVGLEARREFDLGELRERRRFALPMVAAIGGMAVRSSSTSPSTRADSARGWGVAMSTDTAFALGLLALVGPRFPHRLRAFLLTIAVVDDMVALLVIATVYTEEVEVTALLVAAALFGVMLAVRAARRDVRPPLRGARGRRLGCAARVGRGPVVVGLVMGLLTYAYTGRAPRPRARRRSASASSASSRRPSSRGPRAGRAGRRSRRTSGCSSASTRGRAT